MARLLYTLAIHLLTAGIRLASIFHPKAKQWVQGRRAQKFEVRSSKFEVHEAPSSISNFKLQTPNSPQTSNFKLQTPNCLWLHAASLGEFEQGRPILEAVREQHPDWRIVLTFFSPSGYEVRKNYPHADLVCYLPADTPRNAADFLDLIQPDVAIFVKYEFWANYLFELKKRGTPTLLVSALFREKQPFFQWYGGFWRQMLGCFTHFFLQNKPSAELLQSIGFQNLTVAGDTRVDRVLSIAAAAAENEVVAKFSLPQPPRWGEESLTLDPCPKGERGLAPPPTGGLGGAVLVVGSSWEADEAVILQALQLSENLNDTRLIIAPHEPSEKNVERICQQFAGAVRYSEVSRQSSIVNRHSTLVIDNVGLLNTLYRYGTVAYIGGGFGKGIHNTLEPAAWGLPVIFGPKYEKFEEARQFVARGGAFAVRSEAELAEVLRRLQDPVFYQKASDAVREYLEESKGATEQVVAFLKKIAPENGPTNK